jgi:predicted Zn-dependent protease
MALGDALKTMRIRSLRPILICLLLLFVGAGLGCSGGGKKRPKRTILLTVGDDARVGREAAKSVEANIGLLDDAELTAYVQRIGKKLLEGLPIRDFAYKFSIVDQMEPNAFALPGGQIFISRGLMALANNEDELANVIGHEIVHAARRHSAQQQAIVRYEKAFAPRFGGAKMMAAYGRDMEREADELGQKLAAAAGYDPMGMSTFMRRLDQRERLIIGAPRAPTFYDSHPGSRERAMANSMRSRELRWTRDPELGDTRARLLDEIDNMVIGDRPESGMFAGELFMHPALDFEMRFPKGWRTQNSAQAVGATAPRGEAVIYLTADLPEGDLIDLANDFAAEAAQDFGVSVTEKKKVRLGDVDAIRYGFEGGGMGRGIVARVTFFPFVKSTWRIVGAAPSIAANRYLGQILLTSRSFRPLSDESRSKIRIKRLHVVMVRPGEDVIRLGERTGNAWSATETALMNGMLGNEVFEGGELMKILRSERLPN